MHGRPPLPNRRRTPVVAVLGGIASGKSQVARRLAGSNGLLIDADALAHEVLASDAVTELVRARFGASVLGPDGRPDRPALARVVFADEAARRELEGWIHPRVRDRMRAELERAAHFDVAVLDVPLLLENDAVHGLCAEVDLLVFVDAPPSAREERARATRGWSAGEVQRREALQMPLAEKRARADVVIDNSGDLAALALAADRVRAKVLAQRTD
jgi:dephospho-CoA kinase